MRRLSILSLLWACGAPTKDTDAPFHWEGASDNDTCVALTSPGTLSFGRISVLDDVSATVALEVQNTGSCVFQVSASVDDPSGLFTVGAPEADTIAPGEITILPVTFAPDADVDAEASLTVLSDDVAYAEVTLTGSGLAACALGDAREPRFRPRRARLRRAPHDHAGQHRA